MSRIFKISDIIKPATSFIKKIWKTLKTFKNKKLCFQM